MSDDISGDLSADVLDPEGLIASGLDQLGHGSGLAAPASGDLASFADPPGDDIDAALLAIEGEMSPVELSDDPVESYAYFRIGYHRGLDKLRGSGWRGSGYVRWEHETNRGFLRSLRGLGEAAARIGEQDEVERVAQFLRQLDP